MNRNHFRAAIALVSAFTTAASPLVASAQTSYEFKALKWGLVVNGPGSGQTPGPGGGGTPPASNPALSLSTTAINFGDVATNTTETRQVLVSNPGTGPLSFTAAPAVTGDAVFAAGLTTCGETLAAGADCLTDATFSPTTVGTYNGILKFTSALAHSPHEVTLVGTAFNPVSLASTMLPDGMVGTPYSYDFKQLLKISNEGAPNKALAVWSGSGTLPAGLKFDAGTGVLSGTPSATNAGASYRVIAVYKNNQGQQVYTIKVGDAVLEVLQVSPGQNHTCAVTLAGGAKCWGYNGSGQLGDGTQTQRLTPVYVFGLATGVTSIAAGGSHTCALLNTGGAKCWGANGNGRLGDNSQTNRLTPVDVYGLTSGVKSIAAATSHTCALTLAGGAKCWGFNGQNQLGNGNALESWIPTNVSGLSSGAASLTVGDPISCIVNTSGGVSCWGSPGVYGATPKTVAASNVMSVTSGGSHVCLVTLSGSAKCWGDNRYGQVGDSTTIHRWGGPVDVTVLSSGVKSFALGVWHTCAVTDTNAVKCWGGNANGQLGNGTTSNSLAAVDVLGLTDGAAAIFAGAYHTCSVSTGGSAKCWGANSSGQLGDGSTVQRTASVNVLP